MSRVSDAAGNARDLIMLTPIENKALTEKAMLLLLPDGAEWSLWALFIDNACWFQKKGYCFT
jgi:hypothetical protein